MTADDRLSLIRLKTNRARKNLRELQSELHAFNATKPYKFDIRRDRVSRRPIYYLTEVQEPPVALAVTAGDVIHNARTALDHLAYQLVLVGTGEPGPFKNVQFPIAESASKYEDSKRKDTKRMQPEALAAIDRLKPYQGGNDILWRLHHRDNVSKHRVLLTVMACPESFDMGPLMAHTKKQMGASAEDIALWRTMATKMSMGLRFIGSRPAKVGDRLLSDMPDAPFHPDMQFALRIAFSEPEGIDKDGIIETLHEMVSTVETIVTDFRPFLE
jgi:hypothetical protein